jgi:hypothetical protein
MEKKPVISFLLGLTIGRYGVPVVIHLMYLSIIFTIVTIRSWGAVGPIYHAVFLNEIIMFLGLILLGGALIWLLGKTLPARRNGKS